MTINDSDVTSIIPYVLYPKRYLILTLFAFAELCNTLLYGTCNPIAKEVGAIYDISANIVTLSATLYLFMQPIAAFPASYLIMLKGNGPSIKLGTILTIAGVVCRCFVGMNFYWMLIGQTLSGIARPFIVNAQAEVADQWFTQDSKIKLMTLLNFVLTVSAILSYTIPPLFFYGFTIEHNTMEEGQNLFYYLMLFQAILCCVTMLPILFVFQSKPKSPPGPLPMDFEQNVGFMESVKQMLSNYRFLLILLSFTCFFGTYKAYGVVVAHILIPFGYGKSSIAALSTMPIVGGIVGSIVAPIVIKKLGKYKLVVICLELMCILAFYANFTSMYYSNFYLMMIISTLQGFCLLPVIPILLEWGCQIIKPINSSYCIGLMYSGATMGSSFIAQLLVYLINGEQASKMDSFIGMNVIVGLFLLSALALIPVSEIRVNVDISSEPTQISPLISDNDNSDK